MPLTVIDDILYPALRLARVTGGPGRSPSPDQVTDAFQALNRMIDSWSTLRGVVYSIQSDTYILSPPKQSYSIGRANGADFVADRPTRIDHANAVLQSVGSKIFVPIRILDANEWAAQRIRDYMIQWPTAMYPDYAAPNCTLWMLGIPTGSPGLELWTWQVVTQFASETDQVQVPPGYLEAGVLNLACKLADQFGTQISPNIYSDARKALGRIMGMNMPSPEIASADYGTRGTPRGDFNYLSGGLP